MRLLILLLMFCVSPAFSLTVDVRESGAKADGVTDATEFFQQAMDKVAQAGGGIVNVPTGIYLIAGHLSIPANVTLQGEWTAPPRLYAHPGPDITQRLKGSVLLAVEGAGDPDGTPFITLNNNSTLKGIIVHYPRQKNENPPVPYPWTIASGGADNCSILDVLLVNPYQAVDFGSKVAGRHYIRNLYGQPLLTGLFVDQCYDVGRVENVHFWPFWVEGPAWEFSREKGTAFIFGRTDWQYVTGAFCIGYHTGFRFAKFDSGPGNVLMTHSGSDVGPIAMHVEDSQHHAGISISNSQMYGAIVVEPTNTGPVRFTGCGLFGATEAVRGVAIADLAGHGAVSFTNCHFIVIDPNNTGDPLVRSGGYYLNITACDFMTTGRVQLELLESQKHAIIGNNLFRGRMAVENRSKGQVVLNGNLSELPDKTDE